MEHDRKYQGLPKVVELAMKTKRWYKKLKGYNQIVEHMLVDVF